MISNSKKFIALNAQINANNIGFHTLKNYKNIDFVIINEKESGMNYEIEMGI